MSDDTDAHLLNATHFAGRAVALEELAETLRVESGDRWSRGNDPVAIYQRDQLVPGIRELATKARRAQEKELAAHRAEENANG